MSRRGFLSCAAGAVSMALPLDLVRPFPARPTVGHRTGTGWVLLDLQEHGSLGESVSGYQSAQANLVTQVARADVWPVSRCVGLIVPAAREVPPQFLQGIVHCLDAGATVIFESGAGFATRADCRAHRALVHDALHIQIEEPVHLWTGRSRWQGIPYVDYTWPRPTKVRDFSCVVPLEARAAQIIALVDGLPVALKCQRGPGTLVVLGSPLGPALWAGDVEARRWFHEMLRVEASGHPSPLITSRSFGH